MFRDPKLLSLTEQFIEANVSLIKGIGPDIANKVESDVLAAVQRGTLHRDLAEKLAARYGYPERRAKLIARDQVGKYYGQVNAARQRELGVTHFIWRDVSDDRVRDEHAAVDGQRFAYDDPPDFGNGPALPGEEILCRCTAEPDFSAVFAHL
jgi:SPP1 gp7 family putative phage head morphogenesis protein